MHVNLEFSACVSAESEGACCRKAVYSRASLLFFVVAFLSFMGIAAMPAFVEDMQVHAVLPAIAACAMALTKTFDAA